MNTGRGKIGKASTGKKIMEDLRQVETSVVGPI